MNGTSEGLSQGLVRAADSVACAELVVAHGRRVVALQTGGSSMDSAVICMPSRAAEFDGKSDTLAEATSACCCSCKIHVLNTVQVS